MFGVIRTRKLGEIAMYVLYGITGHAEGTHNLGGRGFPFVMGGDHNLPPASVAAF
jgi:arginase family enzyme